MKNSINLDNAGDMVDVDGNWICPDCQAIVQRTILGADGLYSLVGSFIPCKCELERIERAKEEERKRDYKLQVDVIRKYAFSEPIFAGWTFEIDNGKQLAATSISKKYVANWNKMFAGNFGLIYYGPAGTGKTMQAYFTANALIDLKVRTLVTTIHKIIDEIQAAGFGKKSDALYSLNEYDFLVLEDFGVERCTEYVLEQIYLILDARYQSRKPLTITTNLTPTELKTAQTKDVRRIYDRILEMCCIPVKMVGDSQRSEIADDKRKQFNAM